MKVLPTDIRLKKISSVTLWGALVNIVLMIIKLFVGILIKSSALIADGVHSLSDLASDFVVLIGARLSHQPPDEKHPYGHSRYETIATLLLGLILVGAGIGIIWSAGDSIFNHRQNFTGYLVLVVAVISVVSKEILFFITRRVSKITQSVSLYANAWHHRTDSLSSVAVLIGGIISLSGWGYADQVASIVVGFMIMVVAGKILYDCLPELTEHSADRKSVDAIEDVLVEEKDIFHWHDLRTRRLGPELCVDVHILVDRNLSVLESHKISQRIEEKIKERLTNPVNTLIHIEPHIDEMHR